MSDDDLLDLTAAERTLRKLAQDARDDRAAGRQPDDLFECYRLVLDELDRARTRLHALEGEGPHLDGRLFMRDEAARGAERWSVSYVERGTIDRENGEVIPTGWWVVGQSDEVCDEYAFSTIHVEFSYDEHGRDITEQIARRVAVGLRAQDELTATARALLAITADPTAAHPGPRYQEALDALRDALPPFAPELADAPLVTGESGSPAPLVVDHPAHASTLPAEVVDPVARVAGPPEIGMRAAEFDGGPLHELDLYVQLVDDRLPELLATDEGDFWVTYVLTSPANVDSMPRYRYAGSATDSERQRCPYIDANGPRPEAVDEDDDG